MASWRRSTLGLLVAAVLLPLVTVVLSPLRDTLTLPSDLLVYLVVVAVVAAVGGALPGVLSAVVAVGLLNYYFTPPLHTFVVDRGDEVLALVVFVGAAGLVSSLVSFARRSRVRAADATEQAEAATRADQTRSALLRAVSHDLRTPLASARAAVTGLRTPGVAADGPAAHELLATAETSLSRLSRLVENLLDLSRIEAGAMTSFPRAVAIEDAAAQALREVDAARGSVEVAVADDVPEVWADPGLLERIVVNLVTNALRHNRGPQPVVIGAEADDGLVVLTVTDHGPGIAEPDRDTLFEPFQRRGDTDASAGLGLGLALSRGLARAMDGDVTARDTPGGGLTMCVTLPAHEGSGPVPPGAREHAEVDR